MKGKLFLFAVALGFASMCLAAPEIAIPRFVSIRNNQANMRTGPGERYPIEWIYKEKNYPVEIIDEYELWRQIREADGTTGWVNRTQLSSARYALILEETTLTYKPTDNAKVVAVAGRGTVGKIIKCPVASEFCQLDFNTVKGWTRKSSFYGVYKDEVIE